MDCLRLQTNVKLAVLYRLPSHISWCPDVGLPGSWLAQRSYTFPDWSVGPAGGHVTLSRPLIGPGNPHSWSQQLAVSRAPVATGPASSEHVLQAIRTKVNFTHCIALQWTLGLRAICKPLHTFSNILPVGLVIYSASWVYNSICNTP